jgi:hypothetical protein
MLQILRALRKALILFVLLLSVTLVPLAALSVWLTYDNANLATALQLVAREILHRDLVIGKLREARLGETTYLVAEDVSLANPPWAEFPNLVSSAYLELEIDIPSLWRSGPVLIHSLVMERAELNLLAPPDQPPSWNFWPGREKRPADASSPFPVIFSSGHVDGGLVRYIDPDRDVAVTIDKLRIGQESSSDQTNLQFSGLANEHPLSARGSAGPFRSLFTGRNLEMDLDIKLGKLELHANGTATDLARLQGLAMDITAEAPQSGPLLELLGISEIRDGPLSFKGTVSPEGEGLALDASGFLGEFDLQVKGSAERPRQLDGLDAGFIIDGPSLAEAGAMFKLKDWPDVPYRVAGTLRRNGSLMEISGGQIEAGEARMQLQGQLPHFPQIDDWAIELAGQRINLAKLAPMLGVEQVADSTYDLSGKFRPGDNGLELLDVALTSANATLRVDGVVGDGPSYHGTQLQVELNGKNIAETGPWVGLKVMPAQSFQFAADVRLTDVGWEMREATLQSPSLALGLSASVDRLIDATRIQGQLKVATPDLAGTLEAYGLESHPALIRPLEVTGTISGSPDEIMISAGKFELGDNTGEVSGKLGNLQRIDQLALSVGITGPNLHDVSPVELPLVGKPPYTLSTDLSLDGGTLLLDKMQGSLPDADVQLSGQLAIETGAPVKISGELAVTGQSSRDFEALLGIESQRADRPFTLEAEVEGHDSRYRLAPFKLLVGKSDLQGNIEIHAQEVPVIQARLYTRHLHMPFLLPDLDLLEQQEKEREAAGEAFDIEEYTDSLTNAELRQRIIPDTPLNLDFLRRVQGSIKYDIDEIFLHENGTSKGRLELALGNGRLTTKTLEWDGFYSNGTALLGIDVSGERPNFTFALDSRRMPLLWLLAGEPSSAEDALYKAKVTASGNNLRELASTVSGAMAFHGGGGRLDNRNMDLLMGDLLSEIFDRLNPASQTQTHTAVECSAGALIANDGLVEAIPGLILRTRKLDYVAAGTIDLDNESMDLAFSTRSRKGLGISAGRALTNYIKLGGTLANPRMALDAKGAAVSGSAAVATAGWSILAEGLWDRWVASSGDPCKRLLKKARQDTERDYRSLLRGSITTAPPS